jgi:hypothetical protein
MDWKRTLAAVAPAIATALGTPLAGVAVQMATSALGLSEHTEDALQNAIAGGDTETLAKLKQIDKDFLVEMKKLDVDIYKADVESQHSARDMAKDKGIWIQGGLTILFCGLFTFLLGAIFTGEEVVHATMRDIANFLLGTLTGLLVQQFNFWFGSSEGSKRKGTEMASVLKKPDA